MKTKIESKLITIFAVALGLTVIPISHVRAASATEMNQKASQALHDLYARSAAARNVGHHAKAVLVFPEILKAGFIVGAQHGDGALFVHGHVGGYYKTVAAS
jgi:lipid-binding SYLF domain-containing protein